MTRLVEGLKTSAVRAAAPVVQRPPVSAGTRSMDAELMAVALECRIFSWEFPKRRDIIATRRGDPNHGPGDAICFEVHAN